MKWLAFLFLGVLAEGTVEPDCNSTQKVDVELLSNVAREGVLSVPALVVRNTGDAGAEFADGYLKARRRFGLTVAAADYNKIVEIGQELIDAIKNDCAKLEESIQQTHNKSVRSNRINEDLEQMNKQFKTFLDLKPGNQKIESKLSDLPPEPKFETHTRNITAADAFLYFAELKDESIATQAAYIADLVWRGWYFSRKALGLLQTQYRNEVLNRKVMRVYREIADKVYSLSDTIKNCVDKEVWLCFEDARQSIIKLSDEYEKSLEKCSDPEKKN